MAAVVRRVVLAAASSSPSGLPWVPVRWAAGGVPRREDYVSVADSVYGRTVKVRGDAEQHFRLLNNVLAAEGVLRALKAKEFAQAPGITRRLRKKEERRRIARHEETKRILQLLDPDSRCVLRPRLGAQNRALIPTRTARPGTTTTTAKRRRAM
jgi:ribosomal protein S21